MIIKGKIIDVLNKQIFNGEVCVAKGVIVSVRPIQQEQQVYIVSGFVDAHVHVESSMLSPSLFSEMIVSKGTVATVSDPHEIANVLGADGVRFMIEDAKKSPVKFYFGAPSCVPATSFESSGAVLNAKDLEQLIHKYDLKYLAEMMNYPGVVFDDAAVVAKLNLARRLNIPIDGHAPGVGGEWLQKYIDAGVSTDHECSSISEAEEKIAKGMIIQIREGSAAKNFDALWSLIDKYPDKVMLCTDDAHPDHLYDKHLDDLLRRGVAKGLDVFNLLRALTVNPIKHYKLNVGLLRVGDPADMVVLDNLTDFNIVQTYINGIKVFENGQNLFTVPKPTVINKFVRNTFNIDDLRIENRSKPIRIIHAFDGELLTGTIIDTLPVESDTLIGDIKKDYLKIVVLNRYDNSKPVVGFIHGFGLNTGALASSVAHDSHNIVAVGTDDVSIKQAVDAVIEHQGAIAVYDGRKVDALPLPIAGLMSDQNGITVAKKYEQLNLQVKQLGSKLNAPFMTLAFMPLLVIPELKIGDKGLFDGSKFQITSLYVD